MSALLRRVNQNGVLIESSIDQTEPKYLGKTSSLPMTCITMVGEVEVIEHTVAPDGGTTDGGDPDDPVNNQVTY